MKKIMYLAAVVLVCAFCSISCRTDEGPRPTKNVILMVPDGTSTSVLSLAKWYGYYMGDTDYEPNVNAHVCGLMSSTMSNGIMSCSAPAMSGIVTGVPQRAGNISVYPTPTPGQDIVDVDSSMSYQPLATVIEANRLVNGKATGLVVTVEYHHATPAACAAHTPSRGDTRAISRQMASNGLDVVFGGGISSLDENVRGILDEKGVTLIEKDIEAFRNYDGEGKVWALFDDGFIPYDIDRDTSKVPSLAEMTAKAIDILSKDEDGFFLMVEGSKVDYAGHANEPNALITEFIAFDKAVGVALDYAKKHGNTTVIVVPDHGNSAITGGKYGYLKYTSKGVDSIFVGMRDYKATYNKLGKILAGCKVEELRPTFQEWTGIELSENEMQSLIAASGKTESDYMQVANSVNFESAIANILASHTNIGFACSSHTSEYVFLAIYHPKGDIPHGVITNTELNRYLCDVSGLKVPLSEVTQKCFVKHDELLKDYSYEIDADKKNPKLTFTAGGHEVVVPAWESKVLVDGVAYEISTPSVYVKKNHSFYLSREIMDLF